MSEEWRALEVNSQIPRWIIGFGILTALLLATGAGIALLNPQQLASPGIEINSAVRVYAAYTFSRDLGLFVVLSVGLVKRSRSILVVMMGLLSVINFCDALMDLKESRFPVFVIALLLSLVAGAACRRLMTTAPQR